MQRYYVANDDLIPLHEQPAEGYTKLEAIMRAQREAERDCKLFNIPMSEAVKNYHIMDSDCHYCRELDNAI